MTDRATFEKADLFETDLSKAQVITMFLLPSINMKLRPKILDLKPGTRIVSNSFTMEDWAADETANVTEGLHELVHGAAVDCARQGEGTWQTSQGELKLTQQFQMVSGTLGSNAICGRAAARRTDQLHRRRREVHRYGVRELHQGHGQQRRRLHCHEVAQKLA